MESALKYDSKRIFQEEKFQENSIEKMYVTINYDISLFLLNKFQID